MTVMMIMTLVCVVAVAVLLVALIRIEIRTCVMMSRLIQQDTETTEVLDLMAKQLENMVREIQKMKYNQNKRILQDMLAGPQHHQRTILQGARAIRRA